MKLPHYVSSYSTMIWRYIICHPILYFRPANIFIHGILSWDQLQMMISRSTTADLLKMFNKLEEFFSQQFNSSKRAFINFAGTARPPRVPTQKSKYSQLDSKILM